MKKVKRWISGLMAGCTCFLVPVQVFAAEEEQTLGQKMSFAAQNTVIGIVIVFGMLLLMTLVIYLFRFLPKLVGRFTKQDTSGQKQSEESKATAAGPEQATAPDDDAELIAVITAAVAAARTEESPAPVGSFVVRTIKRRA